MNDKNHHSKEQWLGILYAVAAFGAWGILPLYWRMLQGVPAAQILAHRIVWSFAFVCILLTSRRLWGNVRQTLAFRRNRWAVIFGSFFISTNWFLYIWAVNNGHVVEASMGYYINPLLSVALGVAVLREKLNLWQWVSIGLAGSGVIFATAQLGKVPWVALTLAVSFALYGLVKKKADLEALVGLGLETTVVMPVAVGYLFYCHNQGVGAFGGKSWIMTALLTGAGIVTAMPLLWFAQAARRVPLSTVGFTQYISPSLTLIFGVFVFGESFTVTHVISFSFIWAALVLFSLAKTPWLERFTIKSEEKTVLLDKRI